MTIHISNAGTPDLFIRAAGDVWCPAYRVRDRIITDVYETTIYAHHPDGVQPLTVERVNELAADGRVLKTEALIAIAEAPVAGTIAPDRKPRASARLARLDEAGPTRWEKLRRLLNARCGQIQKHRGDDHDEMRHEAARNASSERTESSRELTESEMEDAISYVEHELWTAGFDLDAADEAYRARQAEKMSGSSTSKREAA